MFIFSHSLHLFLRTQVRGCIAGRWSLFSGSRTTILPRGSLIHWPVSHNSSPLLTPATQFKTLEQMFLNPRFPSLHAPPLPRTHNSSEALWIEEAHTKVITKPMVLQSAAPSIYQWSVRFSICTLGQTHFLLQAYRHRQPAISKWLSLACKKKRTAHFSTYPCYHMWYGNLAAHIRDFLELNSESGSVLTISEWHICENRVHTVVSLGCTFCWTAYIVDTHKNTFCN